MHASFHSVKRATYFSEGAGKDDCESDDLPRPVYLQMGKVRGPITVHQILVQRVCFLQLDLHAPLKFISRGLERHDRVSAPSVGRQVMMFEEAKHR